MEMSSQVERVVNAYKESVQFSTPVSATVIQEEGKDVITVSTVWSQDNIQRKVKMNSEMFHSVNMNTSEVFGRGCVEISSHVLSSYSPTGSFRAFVREVPASGKTPKKQYIEIWKCNLMFKQFDLHSLDLHGDVYSDSEFICFEWSKSEEKILFLAEKKRPKTESFLNSKPHTEGAEDGVKGNEYIYMQDWGEQLVGKCQSVLVTVDLAKDEIKVLDVKDDADFFYGGGVWAPDGGVVTVAYQIHPRRLGKVYCTNRPSYIVHISPKGDLTKLSAEGKSVFGPKLSPDMNKLIWMQRECGGPHHSCVSLVKFDWETKARSVVIDYVLNSIQCTGGEPFFGLYNRISPPQCWLSNNRTIVLSTQQRASIKTYAIDTETSTVTEINGGSNEEYSQGVLRVWKDYVICWRSSLVCLPGIYISKIDPTNLTKIKWIPIVPWKPINENYRVDIVRLKSDDPSTSVTSYSALYLGPNDSVKAPLIVWSHGGPQSAFANVYTMSAHFFLKIGFAMVLVNFRGSMGAGKASIDYILGNVGKSDVSDVHSAYQHVIKTEPNVDSEKCVLLGGSHGGFLTLHLAGQFPDDFKSCSARNPVTDLTQLGASDIPDWSIVERGLKYTPLGRVSGEEMDKFWQVSPQYYADKVKIPVLLLIGSKDLRVPPYQGINYYHALKEYNKAKTKLLLYEDNHPLSLSETDVLINTALWYLESFKSS